MTIGSGSARVHGFTIVELLVCIAIIAVLVGLLLPAVMMVRTQSKVSGVKMIISQLAQAMDAYRMEDDNHRFPPVNGDQSLSLRAIPGPGIGTLTLLDDKGLWSPSNFTKDGDSRLLDAWLNPFNYSLVRPTPANAQMDWNWDTVNNHELAWGNRPDATGIIGNGPLPFAYIWSLGPGGSTTNATGWLYLPDVK